MAGGNARFDTIHRVTALAVGALSVVVAVVVAVVVLLDLFGISNPLGDESSLKAERTANRLPAEYLYLDDERVDAYLGQLEGGLAPSEARSSTSAREDRATAGTAEIAQVGRTVRQEETVSREVSLKAADRYYRLESIFRQHFGTATNTGKDVAFHQMTANGKGCDGLARLGKLPEGEIVRILGAALEVPTYALALAKVAHAPQYAAPVQRYSDFRVSRAGLAKLARHYQRGLARYVQGFGDDPRLLLRMTIAASGEGQPPCTVLMPVRYSKLADAPSLLSGAVTVVGKVVRHLSPRRSKYFDVEADVTYGNAVRTAGGPIKQTLGLEGKLGKNAVASSATARYPGLVVLPIAMYK